MPSIKRLQYLHSLLSFTLPVLKKIHSEQCAELDIENKVNGKIHLLNCFLYWLSHIVSSLILSFLDYVFTRHQG